MRKILVLLILPFLIYSQALMRITVKEKDEFVEIILPKSVFKSPAKIRLDNYEVDLGKLKNKRKMEINKDGERTEIFLGPVKLPAVDPDRKYSKMKIIVEGEDSVRVNLPLWGMRLLFKLVKPFIDVEIDNSADAELAREIIDFVSKPQQFLGGYVGPIKFIHVKDEDQLVEIIME